MAKKVYDIMLDETGDLAVNNGDLVTGESTLQHQRLLLLAAPGEFKQNPMVGVDVMSYLLDDSNKDELTRTIQSQYEKDGLRVTKVSGQTVSTLEIKADYK